MDMRFCSECGSALNEQGRCSNPSCPQHIPKTNNENKKYAFKPKTYEEKAKRIVPECVEPDLDEVHIKQYDIARLQTLIKGAFAEGRLQVTNKRVLFRSAGNSILGPTSLQYEFSLEEIAGIEIRKEARFNFFSSLLLILFTYLIFSVFSPIFTAIKSWSFVSTVFSLLMAVAAVFFFFLLRSKKVWRYLAVSVPFVWYFADTKLSAIPSNLPFIHFTFWVAFFAWLISFLYLAFAPNLVINIKAKGGTPSMEIRRKDGFFSFHHIEYTGFSQVIPGPDTDIAMKEIGALIREVQQTGTYTEI